MDTNLLRTATDLEYRTYQALPLGTRLASVLIRIAVSDATLGDAWGRQLGFLLLDAVVLGMPDPGERFYNNPVPRNLPKGYMQNEAMTLYRDALRILGNPQDAQDVMQDVLLNFSEKLTLKSTSLSAALGYIRSKINWKAKDLKKALQRREDDPEGVEKVDDDKPTKQEVLVNETFTSNPYWFGDPDGYRLLESLFTPVVWDRKVVPALTKIHPDMPIFFEAMLEDPRADAATVIREKLPTFEGSRQTWMRWLRDKVGPILQTLAAVPA